MGREPMRVRKCTYVRVFFCLMRSVLLWQRATGKCAVQVQWTALLCYGENTEYEQFPTSLLAGACVEGLHGLEYPCCSSSLHG